MNRHSLTIVIIIILISLLNCSTQKKPDVSGDKIRDYANALYNRELYSQAIVEYQRYLDLYSVDEQQRANINFVIGNIYFDRLYDYENALAAYLKVKHVFPGSTVQQQVDKRIVTCLERLQRSTDAKQALDEAAILEPDKLKTSHPGTTIAQIGDRKITSGDLKYYIGQLPDYIKSQINNRKAKLDFLKQYVATELFFDAAKRKELEKDKEVIEGTFQAKKGLMVQKYLQEEIAGQIQINEEDVELYYKANKDNYAEKDDKGNVKRYKFFQEVQKEVAEDLIREKQQKAYDSLLERMMRAEKVAIYEDLVE